MGKLDDGLELGKRLLSNRTGGNTDLLPHVVDHPISDKNTPTSRDFLGWRVELAEGEKPVNLIDAQPC